MGQYMNQIKGLHFLYHYLKIAHVGTINSIIYDYFVFYMSVHTLVKIFFRCAVFWWQLFICCDLSTVFQTWEKVELGMEWGGPTAMYTSPRSLQAHTPSHPQDKCVKCIPSGNTQVLNIAVYNVMHCEKNWLYEGHSDMN